MTHPRADDYARWIERRCWVILSAGALVAVIGALLAMQLPLLADLSNLLPPQARSVRDLERIQGRTSALGLALCAVASDDPALRATATHRLADRLRRIDRELIADVVVDEGEGRRFAWGHRFLFAPLPDLEAVRDVLQERLRRAKLAANPLYVSLDDESAAPSDGAEGERQDRQDRIARMRAQLREAEETAMRPAELVSRDGKLQLLIVETAFPSAAVSQGERLVAALAQAVAETAREQGPGVSIGITEDVVIAVAEHQAILTGIWWALLLTVSVVGLSMLLYFGSLPALLALFGSLAVGTLATFGVARLVIGHLNSVTAFLSAIVVGNGINFGIIVLARHLESRRRGQPALAALATALGGSFTGTLTAALAAGSAYASLIVTDFRGFRDFGVIGGIGMLLCWASAYLVLPPLLVVLERRGLVRVKREPGLGRLLARALPRRATTVVAVAGALVVGCAVITVRYLRTDPFEYDWQRMRSDSRAATAAHRWMARIEDAFGRQFVGGFVVGADSEEDARAAERLLRARAEDEPGVDRSRALFRKVSAIRDFVPSDQPRKLETLAQIRHLLDGRVLAAIDDDPDLANARALRPPDDLRPLTEADVPAGLARKYTERGGARGRLLFANQASRFDGWNGRHMIAFADAVREIPLPAGTALGGGAFVFADVLRAVTRAGPRATAVALAGVVLFVLIVVGMGRHALITLASVVAGTTAMIAAAALLGMRINFLDFVALPITLGISVDYAVNVVASERGGRIGARRALVTTGSAVALCSWTTTVGYGSLLLSANAGIRSFGAVAILGEATCLVAALTLAPALLELLPRRAAGDSVT